MISEQSKKFINKKWPGIEDKKVLQQNAKNEVFNFAYIFSPPKDANEKFLKKAQIKANSFRFLAIGLVIFALLTFISDWSIGYLAAFGGLIQFLLFAIFFYWYYKNGMRLITCYKELLDEP